MWKKFPKIFVVLQVEAVIKQNKFQMDWWDHQKGMHIQAG